MNNYRMGAYALIAMGLLNWDYQRSHANIVLHSLAIILPGVALLAYTFTKNASQQLSRRPLQIFWILLSLAALVYGFLN